MSLQGNPMLVVLWLISSCLVPQDSTGLPQYDGHHTKGEDDGKWVTYGGYQYNFTGIPLNSLRIAPNAMDALMACQEAFS